MYADADASVVFLVQPPAPAPAPDQHRNAPAPAQVTLGLTVASRIVLELTKSADAWSVLKAVVAVSLVIAPYSSPHPPSGGRGSPSGPSSRGPLGSITLGGAVRVLRRVLVVVVAQLGSAILSPPPSPPSSPSWAISAVESFVVASVALVAASVASRVTSSRSPELARIQYSLQYTYADAVAGLLVDPRVRWVAAVAGAALVVARPSAPNPPPTPPPGRPRQAEYWRHAAGVWLEGVAMAWVNVVVGLIAGPGGISSLAETVPLLSAACLIQAAHEAVPSLEPVQGYVEWNVATIIIGAIGLPSVGDYVAMLAAGSLGAFIVRSLVPRALVAPPAKPPPPPPGPLAGGGGARGGARAPGEVLVGVGTLVLVNGSAQWLMQAISLASPVDTLVVVGVAIVLTRGAERAQSAAASLGTKKTP